MAYPYDCGKKHPLIPEEEVCVLCYIDRLRAELEQVKQDRDEWKKKYLEQEEVE